jgi:hypothetical protein
MHSKTLNWSDLCIGMGFVCCKKGTLVVEKHKEEHDGVCVTTFGVQGNQMRLKVEGLKNETRQKLGAPDTEREEKRDDICLEWEQAAGNPPARETPMCNG